MKEKNNTVDTIVSVGNNATLQNDFFPSPSAPTLEEMGYEIPASLEREVSASQEREIPTSLEREIPASLEREISTSLPPSYEESVVPSYVEVMTHKDKYVVH